MKTKAIQALLACAAVGAGLAWHFDAPGIGIATVGALLFVDYLVRELR